MKAALIVAAICVSLATAQVAYVVTESGSLFLFDLETPESTSFIGTLPFTPAGIDFRPSSQTLYALALNATHGQLYTVSIFDASVTPIGPGFPSSSSNPAYSLTQGAPLGFDVNPKTLQNDGTIRIRVIDSTTSSNLRLHSGTGLIAAVDGVLNVASLQVVGLSGAAYINNVAEIGGVTALYDLASAFIYLQNPPNSGTLSVVANIPQDFNDSDFDIYTDSNNVNYPYAIIPVNGLSLLYSVDISGTSSSPLTLKGIVNADSRVVGFSIDPTSFPDPGCATFPPTAAPVCVDTSSNCPTVLTNNRINLCSFTSGMWQRRAFVTSTALSKLQSASFGVPGKFVNGNCCDCSCANCYVVGGLVQPTK